MPMIPLFKKNCKLADFSLLSNSIAEQHDAIKAVCFSTSLCAESRLGEYMERHYVIGFQKKGNCIPIKLLI